MAQMRFFLRKADVFTGLKLAPGWMIAIKRKVLKSSWLLRTVLCAATPFRFCPFSCPIEKNLPLETFPVIAFCSQMENI
ncbi:hypothetical protein HED55_11450 [Ochrobactrum haematophilum]|uniref:Uncharacterized protein n=1 Tax=Brucella haematophila TaxID=419474 RepID=A0ABX1DQZ8_9HYPH|nr:hypothetical protein [Brucella haematophila]